MQYNVFRDQHFNQIVSIQLILLEFQENTLYQMQAFQEVTVPLIRQNSYLQYYNNNYNTLTTCTYNVVVIISLNKPTFVGKDFIILFSQPWYFDPHMAI